MIRHSWAIEECWPTTRPSTPTQCKREAATCSSAPITWLDSPHAAGRKTGSRHPVRSDSPLMGWLAITTGTHLGHPPRRPAPQTPR